MVAAVGMATATDLYAPGIITTLMTTGILVLLGPLSTYLSAKSDVYQQRHEALHQRIVEQSLVDENDTEDEQSS